MPRQRLAILAIVLYHQKMETKKNKSWNFITRCVLICIRWLGTWRHEEQSSQTRNASYEYKWNIEHLRIMFDPLFDIWLLRDQFENKGTAYHDIGRQIWLSPNSKRHYPRKCFGLRYEWGFVDLASTEESWTGVSSWVESGGNGCVLHSRH